MPTIYVQRLTDLTIKNVLDKVYNNAEVRKYLPDYDEEPEKHISRDFLFSIVNKVDPTFFSRASKELNDRQKIKESLDQVTTLAIKPDLLKILQEARRASNRRDTSSNARALTAMLTTTKKRKRRDIEGGKQGLLTDIQIKRLRFN